MTDLPYPQNRFRIAPQSGAAFVLKQGQTLRIIDVGGEQVADLFCVARLDPDEILSAGHTTDYNGKLFLSQGDTLYSNRSNPMLAIVDDPVGKHIMLYAPCSQAMFEKSYGIKAAHPNCFDNLYENMKPYGIRESHITIPINIFMNIDINRRGEIKIRPPTSKAGDHVELTAEMDLIVGVSACAAGLCNNFKWTPIDVEIYPKGLH